MTRIDMRLSLRKSEAGHKYIRKWRDAKGKWRYEYALHDVVPNSQMVEFIKRLLGLGREPLLDLKAKIDDAKQRISAQGEATPVSLMRWGRAVSQALEQAPKKKPKTKKGGQLQLTLQTKPKVVNIETKPEVVKVETETPETDGPALTKPKTEKKKRPKRARKDPKLTVKKKRTKKGPRKIEQIGEHVWGSRKDLAAIALAIKAGEKELTQEMISGLNFADAAALVNKGNLTPDWMNLSMLKGMDMTPGGAHMVLSVMGFVKAKPPDDHMARVQYASDLRGLIGGLRSCKSREDVDRLISEIRSATFRAKPWVELEEVPFTPDHAERHKRTDEAKARAEQLTKETGVLHRLTQRGYSQVYISRRQPVPNEHFGAKWDSLMKNFTRSKQYKEARNEAYTADQVHTGEYRKLIEKDPESSLAKRYAQHEDGWQYLESKADGTAGGTKTNDAAERRREFLQSSGLDATVLRGWSEAKMWALMMESSQVEREGHTVEVENADERRVRNQFNLREVDYGKAGYMTQADREYHTQQFEGAMLDFAEILGVDPATLSLNGRLSIAFGARGRGKAKAHYEPIGKIINITKYRGGGSLAHEWGHAMDNVVAEHFDSSTKAAGVFLSDQNRASNAPKNLTDAMSKVVEAMTEHPDPEANRKRYKAFMSAAYDDIREERKKFQNLRSEHHELTQKPVDQEGMDRKIRQKERTMNYWANELQNLKEKQAKRYSRNRHFDIKSATNNVERSKKAIAEIKAAGFRTEAEQARVKKLEGKMYEQQIRVEIKENNYNVYRKVDPTKSDFYNAAQLMGKKYWGTPTEMFARSFESYVQQELADKGRKSGYLTGGVKTEQVYNTGIPMPYEQQPGEPPKQAQPYPHGEERKRVQAAMQAFMKELRDSGTLEKALRALTLTLTKAEVGPRGGVIVGRKANGDPIYGKTPGKKRTTVKTGDTVTSGFETDVHELARDPKGHGLGAEETRGYQLLSAAHDPETGRFKLPRTKRAVDSMVSLLTHMGNSADDRAEEGVDPAFNRRLASSLSTLSGKLLHHGETLGKSEPVLVFRK